MLMKTFLIVIVLGYIAHAAAAEHDGTATSRKLLGVFDGLKAVNKVVESHVGNGMKAGQKITKVVQKQVKEVVRADAKIGKAVAKATDKAIKTGEKAVVIGIGEKLSDLSNILTGPSKGHHGGSAAKEVVKTIKAVEHGKQKAAKAFEKAAEERQHAIKKATKQISSTIDHTHSANNKALKGAGRAINKAFLGRP